MDPNIPDEYKEIYQNNWSVIRERVKVGRVKDTYNFPLFTLSDSEISQKVEHVRGQYNQSIKKVPSELLQKLLQNSFWNMTLKFAF